MRLPVVGYPNYMITEDGEVFNINPVPRWRNKKDAIHQKRSNCGYFTVELSRDNIRKRLTIHRLVYQSYVGPIPNGKEVRHLDGDSANNNVSNLDIGTHKENTEDAIKHGKIYRTSGEKNRHSKMTNAQIKEVRKRWAKGDITKTELAKDYPIGRAQLGRVLRGQAWQDI